MPKALWSISSTKKKKTKKKKKKKKKLKFKNYRKNELALKVNFKFNNINS
jgi:hypothetical protein